MKQQMKTTYTYLIAAALIITGATSCQKEVSGNANADANAILATTSTSSTIAVSGGSTSGGTASRDSVYIVNPCEKGTHRDSVAASSLPAAIQAYLSTNYSGNTFVKAFAVKDTAGTVKGYVVIINFNGKPVGLEFKADGTFVKVLEQREKGDINGPGWHQGGRFEKRGGLKDTVALTALSSAITAYYSANYASDTLLKAFKVQGGNYLVLSKNNGLFASLFSSTGVFIARVSLSALPGLISTSEATLPTAALTYLSTTYPNYVLDKAVSVSVAGVLKGYIAVIDANNTRYCVAFDADGKFVAVKTIW